MERQGIRAQLFRLPYYIREQYLKSISEIESIEIKASTQVTILMKDGTAHIWNMWYDEENHRANWRRTIV